MDISFDHEFDASGFESRLSIGDAHDLLPSLGGFSVAVEAVGISWQGKRLPLSPAEARIVAHLMHRRRASWHELNALLGRGDGRISTLRVFLYRLRLKLLAAGAPELMQTVPGWGIVLKDGDADEEERGDLEEGHLVSTKRRARASAATASAIQP